MDFNALQKDLQDAAALVHNSHHGHSGGSGGSGAHSSAVTDAYEFVEELGHGAYGSVMKARKRARALHRQSKPNVRDGGHSSLSTSGASSSNDALFAIKIIDKKKAGSKGLSEVMGEVETLSLLNHPNIVHLEETFQDDNTLWIVMEYVPGGELHPVLKRAGSFPESVARQIIIQLLLAVEYIHQKGIVHRDLKPANMLLKDETDYQIKLADFGFAVLVGPDSFLTSYCGTGAYMAPEIVLDMNYGKPVDIWACGVILYLMIAGEYPFQATPQQDLSGAIVANKWQHNNHPKMQEASPGCRDFLSKLLTTDAKQRITAKEALKHTWIQTALQGLSLRSDAGAGRRGGGEAKQHQVAPLTRLKSWVSVIVAIHRMVFWRKLRWLRANHCDISLLRSFAFLVTGRYEPPRGVMNCSGLFVNNPRAIGMFLMPMVEGSATIDTLDLSDNGIDSVDLLQGIVKSLINHPSLTTLVLERNPIPALAGRGLVRLARAANRIKNIRLAGTNVGTDVMQQVANALKDKKVLNDPAALGVGLQTPSGGTASPMPPAGSSSGSSTQHRNSGTLYSAPSGGGYSATHAAAPVHPSSRSATSGAPPRHGSVTSPTSVTPTQQRSSATGSGLSFPVHTAGAAPPTSGKPTPTSTPVSGQRRVQQQPQLQNRLPPVPGAVQASAAALFRKK